MLIQSQEELKKMKDNFINETIELVKNNMINSVVEIPESHREVIKSFNQAILSVPAFFYKPDSNIREFLYTNYDDYCKDILFLFDEFVKNEVDFDDIFKGGLPENIVEYILTGDIAVHVDEINQFVDDKIIQFIVDPFYNSLHIKIVRHKIGQENYERIKHFMG